jgi:hypothetical protein
MILAHERRSGEIPEVQRLHPRRLSPRLFETHFPRLPRQIADAKLRESPKSGHSRGDYRYLPHRGGLAGQPLPAYLLFHVPAIRSSDHV